MNRPMLIFALVSFAVAVASLTVWWQPWLSGACTALTVLGLPAAFEDLPTLDREEEIQ